MVIDQRDNGSRPCDYQIMMPMHCAWGLHCHPCGLTAQNSGSQSTESLQPNKQPSIASFTNTAGLVLTTDSTGFSAQCMHLCSKNACRTLTCVLHSQADLYPNPLIKDSWVPFVQVKGTLQKVEQLDNTQRSLARLNYAEECEAAINEQIKWVPLNIWIIYKTDPTV